MCPFLKALQASGSTIVAGVTDFLAEVEETGGSWYLFFFQKSVPKELGDNYGLIWGMVWFLSSVQVFLAIMQCFRNIASRQLCAFPF